MKLRFAYRCCFFFAFFQVISNQKCLGCAWLNLKLFGTLCFFVPFVWVCYLGVGKCGVCRDVPEGRSRWAPWRFQLHLRRDRKMVGEGHLQLLWKDHCALHSCGKWKRKEQIEVHGQRMSFKLKCAAMWFWLVPLEFHIPNSNWDWMLMSTLNCPFMWFHAESFLGRCSHAAPCQCLRESTDHCHRHRIGVVCFILNLLFGSFWNEWVCLEIGPQLSPFNRQNCDFFTSSSYRCTSFSDKPRYHDIVIFVGPSPRWHAVRPVRREVLTSGRCVWSSWRRPSHGGSPIPGWFIGENPWISC